MQTLLIVESHPNVREWLERTLQALVPTAAVMTLGSAHDLESVAAACKPDLVMMSLRLPTGSGLEATRVMRAHGNSTPVVLLAGCDLPEFREAARAAGATDFLSKDSMTQAALESLLYRCLPSLRRPSTPARRAVERAVARPHWRTAPITSVL